MTKGKGKSVVPKAPPKLEQANLNKNGKCDPFRTKTTFGTLRLLYKNFTPVFEQVLISEDAIYKMQQFVKMCDQEIGWLGTVREDRENNLLIIEDVFLFEQVVSAAETELSADDIAKFAEDLYENPPDDKTEEDIDDMLNRVRLWGHSHVNMATTPSKTDNDTMNEFTYLEDSERPYMLRLIANKTGSMRIDVYYYKLGLVHDDVAWSVDRPENPMKDVIFSEMEEKIKQEEKWGGSYAPYNGYGYGAGTNTPKTDTQPKTMEGTSNDDWSDFDDEDWSERWVDELATKYPEYFEDLVKEGGE